jgi:hypothetical protein
MIKKPKNRAAFFAAVAALLLVLVVWAADAVVIKIQSTQLRAGPGFFSQPVGTLKAGDRLEKLAVSGAWIQVRTATGAVGWIHSSSAETPRFNLLSMNQTMKTQASASEVALAGKGFNKQVEDSYRAKHTDLNFDAVDRMLQLKISAAQIQDFLKKGKLGEPGGAK